MGNVAARSFTVYYGDSKKKKTQWVTLTTDSAARALQYVDALQFQKMSDAEAQKRFSKRHHDEIWGFQHGIVLCYDPRDRESLLALPALCAECKLKAPNVMFMRMAAIALDSEEDAKEEC